MTQKSVAPLSWILDIPLPLTITLPLPKKVGVLYRPASPSDNNNRAQPTHTHGLTISPHLLVVAAAANKMFSAMNDVLFSSMYVVGRSNSFLHDIPGEVKPMRYVHKFQKWCDPAPP